MSNKQQLSIDITNYTTVNKHIYLRNKTGNCENKRSTGCTSQRFTQARGVSSIPPSPIINRLHLLYFICTIKLQRFTEAGGFFIHSFFYHQPSTAILKN